MTYRAELAPASAADRTPAEANAGAAGHAGRVAGAPSVRLRARFVRVDPALELELFGSHGVEGRVLERAEFDATCQEGVESGTIVLLSEPTLRVEAGVRASLALRKETAFVRAFEITRNADSLVGDPQISVAEEGLVLDGTPRLVTADGTVELDLALEANYLARPLHQLDALIPGTQSAVVVLQLPLAFAQRLSAKAALAPSEVLVLRGIVDAEGRSILACVEGEVAAPEAAALDR
ncbi:MAG: hypothetical protein IPJ77_19500 [Planctomycetes bacterium]|nr:hypothetical protein [Planctomycetota bacterium]